MDYLISITSDFTLVALEELKAYTQGDKPMKGFGPGLTSLLHRAGIYSPRIQLEYLKERLSPLLEQAVILRGSTTLEKEIKIATEIERSLARAKKTIQTGPIQYQPKSAATEGEQQNYQQRYDSKKSEGSPGFGNRSDNRLRDRKCFKCGKKGHIKKDCWSKKEQEQNNQEVQGSGLSEVQDSGNSEKEDEVDIFAHIMNNNQDIKHNVDQITRHL